MAISRIYRTQNPEETKDVGKKLATLLIRDPSLPRTVCLYGELGSGKTIFSQGFGFGLDIKDRLISPTYLFMKEYPLNSGKILYHIDLYRDVHETVELQEILTSGNAFFLIEWAEKLRDVLPSHRFDIYFTSETDTIHTVSVKSIGV